MTPKIVFVVPDMQLCAASGKPGDVLWATYCAGYKVLIVSVYPDGLTVPFRGEIAMGSIEAQACARRLAAEYGAYMARD